MRNVPEGGMKTKEEKSERVKNKIGTVLGAWKTKVGREECEGTKKVLEIVQNMTD